MHYLSIPHSITKQQEKYHAIFLWHHCPKEKVIFDQMGYRDYAQKHGRPCHQETHPKKLMLTVSKSLQASTLLTKYSHKPFSYTSSTWRNILHGWQFCQHDLKWNVGNGHLIKFWINSWISHGLSLRQLIVGSLPLDIISHPASLNIHNGFWDLSTLPFELPPEITTSILYTPLSLYFPQPDSFIWPRYHMVPSQSAPCTRF